MNPKEESSNGTEYRAAVLSFAGELVEMYQNHSDKRILLGIIGPPATGKSTFANDLVTQINEFLESDTAIGVPMDGFHLPNATLREQGTWEIKGRPETFDAEGFINLLTGLHDSPDQTARAPVFDRATDEPVADGLTVEPHHHILIIEGNYLLYDKPPWDKARALLTEVWYLDAPPGNAVSERLRVRHANRGLSADEVEIKIASTDGPNALLIESTRARAERIIQLPQDKHL